MALISTKDQMKKVLFYLPLLVLLLSLSAYSKDYKNVALVSSSTQFDELSIGRIDSALKHKGYSVTTRYLEQVVSDFGYSETDEIRATKIIEAMLDDNVDIVWFARGGGGALNLLPYFYAAKDRLRLAKPKVLVGFSDVTALHLFVNKFLNWPSVHGVLAGLNKDLAASMPKSITTNDLEPIPSIKSLFTEGVSYEHVLPLNELAKNGTAGRLIGGNLTLVLHSLLTPYQPDFSGKVLFLEDVGSSFRQLDRSLHQLQMMKDLDVQAIIFGQFYPLDPTDPDRLIYKSVIQEFARNFKKPVYYYPFLGHGRKNNPLILGVDARFTCPENSSYCALRQKAYAAQSNPE